jgi:hypothetical protein
MALAICHEPQPIGEQPQGVTASRQAADQGQLGFALLGPEENAQRLAERAIPEIPPARLATGRLDKLLLV